MADNFSGQLIEPIAVEDGQTVSIRAEVVAPIGQPAVDLSGDNARLEVTQSGAAPGEAGAVLAPDAGNTAVQVSGNNSSIGVSGTIAGAFNGINATGEAFTLDNFGTITSDSRAVNLGNDGAVVENRSDILGTGNQRNGTVYVDGPADDVALINRRSGTIDAGVGNTGDGVSVQVGAASEDAISEDISIINQGLIAGRGQPEFAPGQGRLTANGSSGVRFFNGSGTPEATLTGLVLNNNGGVISSEAEVGFLGGLVIEDGVAFDGRIVNRGLITGPQNGLYIGNANHDLDIVNNVQIESGSRAVNLDGNNVTLTNRGTILGTGNQRNGTVYIDGTGDNQTIINQAPGIIDAGAGNLGDGISVQVGAASEDAVNENINIFNAGQIAGRGQAAFAPGQGRLAANGSSGVRFFNGSGTPEATVTGSLTNSRGGVISAEVETGFLGAVVVEDSVAFDGQIRNDRGALISGARNGLYIGNADHDLRITNTQTSRIESGSRAVNLDGDNVTLVNRGDIVGTGDQRNGTVYIDGTGDNQTIINQSSGVIDAGAGNSGSGVSVQVGATSEDALSDNIVLENNGLIQGRGTANVPAGVRFFSGAGVQGATINATVTNGQNGVIASETAAGVLIESGVAFNGTITNAGTISGNNLAIDATGALGSITVVNEGVLEGAVQLGDGSDTFVQAASQPVSRIDGGEGIDTLDLSGQSTGVVIDLDLNTPVPGPATQDGAILDAPGGTVVSEIDNFENVVGTDFDDLILGNNEINVLEGGAGNDAIHSFAGADTLDGGAGIDTALFTAGGGVTVDLDEAGNAISSFGDTLISFENINGANAGNDDISGNSGVNVLNGQGGDDTLNGEGGADTLIGGTGDDLLTGGTGSDTFVFAAGFAADTVTDFDVSSDVLDISAFGPDFNDLIAAGTANQVGADAVLDFGSGDVLTLQNVALADLTPANLV